MKKLFIMFVEGYNFHKYGMMPLQEEVKILNYKVEELETMLLHPEKFKNGEIEILKDVIRVKEAIREREKRLFFQNLTQDLYE